VSEVGKDNPARTGDMGTIRIEFTSSVRRPGPDACLGPRDGLVQHVLGGDPPWSISDIDPDKPRKIIAAIMRMNEPDIQILRCAAG
jgi:hypothetical protein